VCLCEYNIHEKRSYTRTTSGTGAWDLCVNAVCRLQIVCLPVDYVSPNKKQHLRFLLPLKLAGQKSKEGSKPLDIAPEVTSLTLRYPEVTSHINKHGGGVNELNPFN
jgi:hypothetical protein